MREVILEEMMFLISLYTLFDITIDECNYNLKLSTPTVILIEACTVDLSNILSYFCNVMFINAFPKQEIYDVSYISI